MKSNTVNQIDYFSAIAEAFPKAVISFEKNFDDFYFGWEFSPSPGYYIRFMVQMEEQTKIKIIMSRLVTSGEGAFVNAIMSIIYKGEVPPNSEMEIDLDFIKSILENYRNFGHKY